MPYKNRRPDAERSNMPAFFKNKWLLCPLALLFSLILALRLWLGAYATEAEGVYLITVVAEKTENGLAEGLLAGMAEGDSLSFADTEGRLFSFDAEASRRYSQTGESYASRLYSDLSLSFYAPLTQREGCLYASGIYLAVGKTVTLSSSRFIVEGRIVKMEPAFHSADGKS